MPRRLVGFLLFTVLLVGTQAHAQQSGYFKTGNELYRQCSSLHQKSFTPQELANNIACTEYIKGVADALDAWSHLIPSGLGARPVCLPAGVTAPQVEDVVMKWLENHPETRHWVAHDLILAALSNSWACATP